MKVSIIVTCWNKTHFLAMAGMSAIGAIRAFTDPSLYELIVIENDGYPLLDEHHNLRLEEAIHIKRDLETEDQGYCADMNQGASLATGEYLVFIENDVIVHEGWLEGLMYYLDNNLADVVIPNQMLGSYEQMNKYKAQSFEEAIITGIQDQGLMMIRKEVFEKAGRWDIRFKKIFGWKAFQKRLTKVQAKILTTFKVSISHLGGATYWYQSVFDQNDFFKQEAKEMKIIREEVDK